jgi:hypothetical protein
MDAQTMPIAAALLHNRLIRKAMTVLRHEGKY